METKKGLKFVCHRQLVVSLRGSRCSFPSQSLTIVAMCAGALTTPAEEAEYPIRKGVHWTSRYI